MWQPYMKAPESKGITDSQSSRLLRLTGTNMANKTPGRADRESGKTVKLWVSIKNLKGHLWHGTYKIFAIVAFLFYFYCMSDSSGCLASRSPCVRFVRFGSTIVISWKGIPVRVIDYIACVVFFSIREDTIQAKRHCFMFILMFLTISYQIRWMDVQSHPLPLTFVLSKVTLCCKRARKWKQEQEQRWGK